MIIKTSACSYLWERWSSTSAVRTSMKFCSKAYTPYTWNSVYLFVATSSKDGLASYRLVQPLDFIINSSIA